MQNRTQESSRTYMIQVGRILVVCDAMRGKECKRLLKTSATATVGHAVEGRLDGKLDVLVLSLDGIFSQCIILIVIIIIRRKVAVCQVWFSLIIIILIIIIIAQLVEAPDGLVRSNEISRLQGTRRRVDVAEERKYRKHKKITKIQKDVAHQLPQLFC